MFGGNLEGDKRAPNDSRSNPPICSMQEAIVVNPFTEILPRPQSNRADKAMPGFESVDHFLESLLSMFKTFF